MTAKLCCAYLRVYQQLGTFPAAERKRIERALKGGRFDEPPAGRPGALGLVSAAERREVFAKTVDGELYVCPSQTKLRMLLGMLAFRRALPDGVDQVFFTSEEIEEAQRELEQLQSDRPELRPYLLQSPWHVPLRWFAAFDNSERRIEQAGDHPTLRYETTMADALGRIERALGILKGGVVHPVVVGMVYELNEWLNTFNRSGIVELDYASVSNLFDPDELADDHSATDIWAAIEALASGDGMKAGLYYQRVNERWAPKRARESFN